MTSLLWKEMRPPFSRDNNTVLKNIKRIENGKREAVKLVNVTAFHLKVHKSDITAVKEFAEYLYKKTANLGD